MAVRYFRTVDGLGRIVLPAVLLHHLNSRKRQYSCFYGRKGWLLNRFPSRLPAKPHRLLPLSIPRTARTDNQKSFRCRCLENDKTASLIKMNCTLFVRQYDILNNKWGDFMTKGIGNKRYTPEFKKIVVETMREEGLSYKETRLRFEIAGEDRVRNWERIYLEEGPEGLAVERRGRKITGRPRKLPQSTEEDLIAENQRLRAEVAYLKNLQALVLERERRQQKKRW